MIKFQTTQHNITILPESVGNLSELQQLRLQNNNLSLIPSSIGNLSELNTLKVYLNPNLETIPDEIGQLTNLDTLKIHFNHLNSLPESLCNLDIDWSSSETFQVEYNYLCPPYPECLTEDDIGYQDTSECVECSVVLSDLNNDLSLNVMDVILMVGCVLSESCDECSDFNQDGSTDILDIVDLVNVILGQE